MKDAYVPRTGSRTRSDRIPPSSFQPHRLRPLVVVVLRILRPLWRSVTRGVSVCGRSSVDR
jgi:hypothetical protein